MTIPASRAECGIDAETEDLVLENAVMRTASDDAQQRASLKR